MAFSVQLRTEDSTRAITELGEKAPLAIMRALNRTASNAKTAMTRVVAGDLGVKAGVVRDRINIMEARRNNLVATLYASAKRIPLIQFKAKGPRPSRGRGRGVTAKIGAGRYPHAFIARMSSGHEGVFQRVPGAKRRGPLPNRSQLPITELHGPSIAVAFQKHGAVAEARASEMLLKNVQHELSFALRRQGAR